MTERPESNNPSSLPQRIAPIRPPRPQESPIQRHLRRFRRNRFWLLLFLWVAAALPELILHTATSKSVSGFFSSGLLLGPLFALVPGMMVFILCTAIPYPKVNYWISLCYTAILFLLHAAELIWFRMSGTFCSLPAMVQSVTALRFGHTILPEVWSAIPVLLGMGLPLLLLVTMGRSVFSFRPLKRWKQHIPMALGCILVQLLCVLILPLFGGTGDNTPYSLYHSTLDYSLSVNRLGLLTTFRVDARRILTGRDATGSIVLESTPPETDAPSGFIPPLSHEPEPITPASTTPSVNVLDLDFGVLADNEDNEAVVQLHRWFASREASLKNDKTGIFRNCNLIQISAEAFRDSDISRESTPTLWKMVHEGYRFTNHYIPEWGVSSSTCALLTGTIPGGNGNFGHALDNFMPLTMVQQLIGQGYSAWALHSCGGGFCESRRDLEALGYEWRGCEAGTAADLLDRTAGTFAAHSPFTLFCSLSDQQGIGELEQTVTLLTARLDAAGILQDTVILLTSPSAEGEQSIDRTGGCVIWKPGLEPETIDAPTSHPDLLPTLSNLFGLEFDSRLYMGRDVFSSAQSLVLLPDRSWVTDRAIYNPETGEVTNLTDHPVDDGYIESIRNEVNNRLTVSARILEYDYWRILFG